MKFSCILITLLLLASPASTHGSLGAEDHPEPHAEFDLIFQTSVSPLLENPYLHVLPPKPSNANFKYPLSVPRHMGRPHFVFNYNNYRYSRQFTGLPQTAIRATASGTVIYAGRYRGIENLVVLKHHKMTAHYSQLGTIFVRSKQHVEKGEVIGAMGSTGIAPNDNPVFRFAVHRSL